MRTQFVSPTYPTWALVGGTSRPAGETVFLNSNVIHWQIVYTVPPIIIFQGHQHLAAYLGPQELLGVMEASLN